MTFVDYDVKVTIEKTQTTMNSVTSHVLKFIQKET